MTVETTRFGRLDVDDAQVLSLTRGLIGYPNARQFILVDHAPNRGFQWLQSVDDPALAFLVVNPYAFFPDYEVVLSTNDAEMLGIGSPEEARVFTTVSVRPASQEVTTNLLGPVVVGTHSQQAAQLVLDGDRYTTRHPLPTLPARSSHHVLQPAA